MLEKKLWSQAIFDRKGLDIWEILKRLKYISTVTKSLKILGTAKREEMESRQLKNRQTFKEIMKRIMLRSPFVQNLHFDRVWFDWTRDFSITKFPASLRSLIFTNCILPKDRKRAEKTFTNIFEHMPHLAEIRLEYCNFFAPNDLMPLSKLNNLKILSLRGCKKLRNCVPYISLSCRFGFKKLEVLDLRETCLTDSEVQCLNALKTLKELYLEYPEMEPSANDSDDEDEFFQYLVRRTDQQQPQAPQSEPQPSTSSTAQQPPNNAAQDDNFDAPSTPESLSDSESEPSPAEENPTRTIFIQANISENASQNARLQVIISDEIPHAR